MKRLSLVDEDEDDLMRLTRRVLNDFVTETRRRGHAVGKVVYVTADGEWSFPLAFDEFLKRGRDLLRAEGHRRIQTVQSMGTAFALLGLDLAQNEREKPVNLVAVRQNWEETFCCLLRTQGPQTVVIAEYFVIWPSGISPCPGEPPVIVALGLHAARIVGYVCAHRAGESRGKSFGKPVALSMRLAHVLGEKKYLKIFGPGRM